MSAQDLLHFDKTHLWHPYTSIEEPLPVYSVASASSSTLTLTDGRQLVDGMSSWWAAIHGYNNPVLNRALVEQVSRVSHVMFGGLTHEPAVELGKILLQLVPKSLNRIFYCDSGSVAIEVAMKMAMQYMHALGQPQKKRFVTIRGGYHGDTFHGMSVCDPVNGMHGLYAGVLPEYFFADRPTTSFFASWDAADFVGMRRLVEENQQNICAIILEPIVQGAGGMYFYHPQYLREVRALCDEYGLLLIADEIATGFGRTGKLFACEHAGIEPDILCLGKAITGGYMSFAATLATEEVGRVISSAAPGVFMHGPTFMGNPLACSVAKASLQLLIENDWQTQVEGLAKGLEEGLAPCLDLDCVAEVRVLGGIGVVELHAPLSSQGMVQIQAAFVEAGIWVRPFGRLVYLMPPYIMSKEELAFLTAAVFKVLATGDY
ncbi:adenosylmethionine--8-amino-7-oxononanoate transaminase [Desulfotalea psychrophila]|nr:adenosylmethionine--8-amino-7-oxononanoate transaminase [Desulfotalea psychrophila]